MKSSNKKRIESLEKILKPKKSRLRYAKVIHDPTIPNFNPRSIVDADIILMLPDNGRR